MLIENVKQQLNINSTLEILSLFDIKLDTEKTSKEAFSVFESNPAIPGIILIENGKYIGMVSRKCFFEVMSKPYSLELFLKRSIDTFYQDLEIEDSLIIPESTLISNATSLALQRNAKDIYEPIVVITESKNYKILDIDQLLLAQSIIHIQTLEQLKKNVSYVKNLLNNSGQGFLTIKDDLYVESQYSNECRNIFGREIDKHFFPKLLFPNDEKQQTFVGRLLIRILTEEDKNSIAKYIPLLPEEVVINLKHIRINYKLIKNTELKDKKKFMIILTDITDRRLLENQIENERNILKMVVSVVVNFNDFRDCVKEFKNFYRYGLLSILESDKSLEFKIFEIYRQIHTFKGNFAQLDPVNIVKELHNVESEISKFNEINMNHTISDLKTFIFQFHYQDFLDKDMKILNDVLGENYFRDIDVLKISTNKLLEIENRICSSPFSEEIEDIILELRKLRSKNLKELLTPYSSYCVRVGERNNKIINKFSITGDDVYINPEEYNSLIKTLIHIFRNAVDHGIEDPNHRVLCGKSESGNINCDVRLEEETITIIITDDGAGINTDRIRTIIAEKNILSAEELDKLSEKELIQFIFKDGISTKSSISELSGRGIGLAAVYSELNKLEGKLEVNSQPGFGAEFKITIPLKKFKNNYKFESMQVLNIILQTTESFLKNEINFRDVILDSIQEYKQDRLTLKTFTSFIGIKGKVDAKVIITIEYKLAKYLLNHFIGSEEYAEDEQKFLEDTVSETLNTIIGNSTQELVERGKSIEFGTPVIMTSDEAVFKYSPKKKWNCSVKTDKGDFILYIIQ